MESRDREHCDTLFHIRIDLEFDIVIDVISFLLRMLLCFIEDGQKTFDTSGEGNDREVVEWSGRHDERQVLYFCA